MNWIPLKLCLFVVVILTPYFVLAEDNGKTQYNDDEEMLPLEHHSNSQDDSYVEKKLSDQASSSLFRQSFIPNIGRYIGNNNDFQLAHGLIQAPLIGQPQDAQLASSSNKVVLVLNNDKNKFAETAKSAEEPLKRLTRNPEGMDDLLDKLQQVGGDVTQQLLGQASESAPDIYERIGQAFNGLFSILAQAQSNNFSLSQSSGQAQLPGDIDFAELSQRLSQSFPLVSAQNLLSPNRAPSSSQAQLPGDIDFAELSQRLSQSFPLVGAQNLLNPNRAPSSGQAQLPGDIDFAELSQRLSQSFPLVSAQNLLSPNRAPSNLAAAAPKVGARADKDTVGAAGPEDEQLVGSPGLFNIPRMRMMPPFGLFGPLPSLCSLLPMGSEISEVRVLPEKYSPYKISPKQVDDKTIGEMKLKAILQEALNEKTIPILWFHLPPNSKHQKSDEDLEIEAKLKIFEQQVIDELKQLQDLSKMANELKTAQLNSGVQPTPSLTTKLKLSEKPIYDITLGDIETTLKDEHFQILMQAIQNQNVGFNRQQQATTKHPTELTGTAIKRQTKTAKDNLKEDLLKMMAYAYRVAALNGNDWIKQKATISDEKDISKITMTTNGQQGQSTDANMRMTAERQWLEDKHQQMAIEAEKQRQQIAMQNQQMSEQRQMLPSQMQQQMPLQWQQIPRQNQMSQMVDSTMRQQPMPEQRQMMPPEMQQPIPLQRQMMPTQMQQSQIFDHNMRNTQQPMMTDLDIQQQRPMQRQWAEANLQQNQKQFVLTNTPEMKSNPNENPKQSAESKMPVQSTTELEKTDQLSEQRQQVVGARTPENIVTDMSNMPIAAEAKPQMAENVGSARHKGMGDLIDVMGIFGGGKSKGKGSGHGSQPTVINYYYTTDGSRYPPVHAPAGSYHSSPQNYGHAGGYGAGYTPSYTPHYHGSNAYGSNTYDEYRTATGDDEIVAMLQQQQQHTPKLMMMMLNNEETTPTTETKNYKKNAENLIENHFKRLAKKQTKSFKSAAANLVVLRNKNNNIKKLSRSRRKRSTEYATLEPIDESSLNALRKTYKNSLKEITLNPNETPTEALMRYNAESIREALEKANKQPIEILAGGEDGEDKGNERINVVEKRQNQHFMPQEVSKQLPERYAVNENDQFAPVVSAESAKPLSNKPSYATVPVVMQQTQSLTDAYYDSDSNQERVYNNLASKYNTPEIYSSNNKVIAPKSFLSMYDTLETAPYRGDYSVPTQPYYLTNHNAVEGAPRPSKSLVYQQPNVQPKFSYNDFLSPSTLSSPSNAINKIPQPFSTSGHHIMDNDKANIFPYGNYVRELPATKTHYTVSQVRNKNGHINEYSPTGLPQAELTNQYRFPRPQELPSLDNLMTVIQEQLDQCCSKCKENILKDLDETLRHRYYGGGNKLKVSEINLKPYSDFLDRSHILTYRKPMEEDIEYKQWLSQMSEKGYNTAHLTKQHQNEYLKDGKPNLHVETEQNAGHDVERIFVRNNQSCKRETAMPETEEQSEKESEEVTDSTEKKSKVSKLKEEKEEKEKEEKEDEAEPEEVEAEIETKNLTLNEQMIKKPPTKIENDIKIEQIKHKNVTVDNKETSKKENIENSNTTKILESEETTTHNAYALRGQFRTHNANPEIFNLNQGKQFDNYKNVNKLGIAKATLTDKLEEKRDLSQHSKEKITNSSTEEETNTTTSSSNATTTPSSASYTTNPLTTPAVILVVIKTANATNTEENPKKLSRRRAALSSKSQKSVKSSPKLETTK